MLTWWTPPEFSHLTGHLESAVVPPFHRPLSLAGQRRDYSVCNNEPASDVELVFSQGSKPTLSLFPSLAFSRYFLQPS